MPARIYHIATRADWAKARRCGAYTTSTLGRSLAEEGFIHASHPRQVRGVFDRYYRNAGEALVLLTIDPAKVTAPIEDAQVGDERYPHIHGPLNTDAVLLAAPLNEAGNPDSTTDLFLRFMRIRMGAGLAAMALGVGAAAVGGEMLGDLGRLCGLVFGLLVGTVGAVAFVRSRDA